MKKFFGRIGKGIGVSFSFLLKQAKLVGQKITAKKEKKPVSKFTTYLIGLLFNLVIIGIIFSVSIRFGVDGLRLIVAGSLASISSLIYFGMGGGPRWNVRPRAWSTARACPTRPAPPSATSIA